MNSLNEILGLLNGNENTLPKEALTVLANHRSDLEIKEKISGKEYWHFVRSTRNNNRKMVPGEKYEIGVVPNPNFEYMLTVGYEHENVCTSKYINDNKINLLSNPDLLYKLSKESLNEMTIRNRELILEIIRLRHYNDKPSRLYCVWLMDSEDMVSHWRDIFSTDPAITSKLVKVRATGNVFRADATTLHNGTLPLNISFAMSHLYWGGISNNLPSDEILFEGNLEVIEYCD